MFAILRRALEWANQSGPIHGPKQQGELFWMASIKVRSARDLLRHAVHYGEGTDWAVTPDQLAEAQRIYADLCRCQNRLMNLGLERLGSDRRIDVETGRNIAKTE